MTAEEFLVVEENFDVLTDREIYESVISNNEEEVEGIIIGPENIQASKLSYKEAFDLLNKLIPYFEDSKDFKESYVDWITYARERIGEIKEINLYQPSLYRFVVRR